MEPAPPVTRMCMMVAGRLPHPRRLTPLLGDSHRKVSFSKVELGEDHQMFIGYPHQETITIILFSYFFQVQCHRRKVRDRRISFHL